jgi:hypothetical protein
MGRNQSTPALTLVVGDGQIVGDVVVGDVVDADAKRRAAPALAMVKRLVARSSAVEIG